MTLKLWQVDAFAAAPLEGNPAAVVPLDAWLDTGLMQRIAGENNLAETAFFVETSVGRYQLRWFTPAAEVELCGHATLASAWLIFGTLAPNLKRVDFETRSGTLTVTRGDGGWHVMSLPADHITAFDRPNLANDIGAALGVTPPAEIYTGRYLMAVWNDAKAVHAIRDPGDIARVLSTVGMWGLIATAPGDEHYDFVSRFFAPEKAVPEDPVTGSAHCALTPFWAKRLGKAKLKARQASPRGGDILCTDDGARTVLCGPCALYMTAEILV